MGVTYTTCANCGKELGRSFPNKVYCCSTPRTEYTKPVWPRMIHAIAKRRKEGDRGVGDTIEWCLAKMGGNQFKWVIEKLGIECGCNDRQKYLNNLYPYV